jgi:hypothetical protein
VRPPSVTALLVRLGLGACVIVWAWAPAGPAAASNYFLEQITRIASKAEIRSLRRLGIRTTDELAYYGATPAQRRELARQTGLTPGRLAALGAMADLMRLRGIGPDAARVLAAAGCPSLTDLQRADPQALAEAVKRVNDRTRLSQNPPRVENLTAWVAASRELPARYQPDETAQSMTPPAPAEPRQIGPMKK